MMFVLLCLITFNACLYSADDQLQNANYLQAVRLYTDNFGDLKKIYTIPQDAMRDAARAQVNEVRTQLITIANQCLASDSFEAAGETMHLVGLLDYSLFEDQKPVGFAISPRKESICSQIREKLDKKPQANVTEYQEALRLYKSFFGEEQPLNYSPRGSVEVSRVIDDQKTKLLGLACDALLKENKDDAKKIMKLVGYMTCYKSPEQAPGLVSPRVVNVWSRILSKNDADQLSSSSR